MKCEGENLVFHESLVNIVFVKGTEWTLLFRKNLEPFQKMSPQLISRGLHFFFLFISIQLHIFTQTGVKYEKFWLIEFKEEEK